MEPEQQNGVVEPQVEDQAQQQPQPQQQPEPIQPELPESFEEFYLNHKMSDDEPEPEDTNVIEPEQIDPSSPVTFEQLQQMMGNQQPQVDPNLQQQAEFGRQILENPTYRDALLDIINKEQQQNQPAGPELQKYEAPPEAPQKPAGFSHAKALEDPESVHAQYLDQFQDYLEKKAAWETATTAINAVNAEETRKHQEMLRQQEQERLQKAQQEQMQQQEQQEQIRVAYKELTSAPYNLNDAQARQFISDIMSGTFEQNPAVFVNAWLQQQGQKPQNTVQTKQNLQQMQQKANQQYNQQVQPVQQPVRSPAGAGAGGGLPAQNTPTNVSSTPDPMLLMQDYLLKEKQQRDRKIFG